MLDGLDLVHGALLDEYRLRGHRLLLCLAGQEYGLLARVLGGSEDLCLTLGLGASLSSEALQLRSGGGELRAALGAHEHLLEGRR